MSRGRPMSEETKTKLEALALLERYKRGELIEASSVSGVSTKMEQPVISGVIEAGLASRFREVMQEEGKKLLSDFRSEVTALNASMKAIKGKTLFIQTENQKYVVNELVHEKFETLLRLVSIGVPAMLVGPAGSVKTSTAVQVATTLEMPFYVQSVSSQTSKSDLFGFVTANGVYVPSAFRKAYEAGGVFVLDEIDAGNANVLVLLNNAISGTYCLFPDSTMVQRHEDFKFIATANTAGTGAKRDFVGRNQLDAATLDRFAIIDWPIDEKLEWSFVDGYEYGDAWFQVVCSLRKKVYNEQILMQVSPRMTIRGAQMLEIGMNIDEVIDICVGAAAPEQKKTLLTKFVKDEWLRV
jgi:AAA domain (dynein-related subfamily)